MTDLDTLLTKIAYKHFDIETLEPQNSDSADFHDIGVAGLKKALQAAYEAGAAKKYTEYKAELTYALQALFKCNKKSATLVVEQHAEAAQKGFNEGRPATHVAIDIEVEVNG